MTIDISQVLIQGWERLIAQYKKGLIILTDEKSLELFFVRNCENVIQENKLNIPIGRQKEFYGKRVDVWVGNDTPNVIELKIYHDTADWKGTETSRNTVETDLQFAKGDSKIWVGVIDAIPSTNKQKIPFNIEWKECEIVENIFKKNYKDINPISSPPRERKLRYFFVNGKNL